MNLTRTLMAGVAASTLLMATGGCNYNDQPPCPDPDQPCKGQPQASSPGYGGGYSSGGGGIVHVYGGSNSVGSSEGDAAHGSSEGGSFGRSGGFGHGGGGEGGG